MAFTTSWTRFSSSALGMQFEYDPLLSTSDSVQKNCTRFRAAGDGIISRKGRRAACGED